MCQAGGPAGRKVCSLLAHLLSWGERWSQQQVSEKGRAEDDEDDVCCGERDWAAALSRSRGQREPPGGGGLRANGRNIEDIISELRVPVRYPHPSPDPQVTAILNPVSNPPQVLLCYVIRT